MLKIVNMGCRFIFCFCSCCIFGRSHVNHVWIRRSPPNLPLWRNSRRYYPVKGYSRRDEVDLASFFCGQLLTDAALNAGALQLITNINADNSTHFYLPVGSTAIFGIDQNADSLPSNWHPKRSGIQHPASQQSLVATSRELWTTKHPTFW